MTNGPWNLSVDIFIILPETVTQDKKKKKKKKKKKNKKKKKKKKKKKSSLKHQIEFTADLKRRIGEKQYFDYFY